MEEEPKQRGKIDEMIVYHKSQDLPQGLNWAEIR